MRIRSKFIGAGVAVLAVVASGTSAYAALTDSTNFSQSITGGAFSTFIGDASGVEVVSPSVSFAAATVSNAMQTSTGTFGTSGERIYVDNPGAITGSNGWTLSLAATSGASAKWTSGGNQYSFNGAAPANGQLTVNATPGTLTAEVGTTTGITKGTSSTFSGGTNTPINLLTAASTADDINRVYLTGVSLSQTIPASTPAGTYTLDFTQTAAQV
ncbi:MAG TPA: hypothetical protein VGE34_01745 [Candidatus Saccharimonadales bacterium]